DGGVSESRSIGKKNSVSLSVDGVTSPRTSVIRATGSHRRLGARALPGQTTRTPRKRAIISGGNETPFDVENSGSNLPTRTISTRRRRNCEKKPILIPTRPFVWPPEFQVNL